MTKAILVIDMPKDCGECVLCQYPWKHGKRCSIIDEDCYEDCMHNRRNKLCPLKPMPEKREKPTDSSYDFGFAKEIDGYNACIDELLEEGYIR